MDAELRHMTSAGHLARSPNRAMQRLGSRSPNSIPSSPTSVHSSSSAIFERDIEPIVPPSPLLTQNPHRIPRAKGTEHLEYAVPSVLDSAVSVLTGIDELPEVNPLDHIAVVAPAAAAASNSPATFESILARSPNSGFASPIGSFRSRSPSPLGLRVATAVPGVISSIPILNIPPPMGIGHGSSPSHSGTSSPPAQGISPLPTPFRPTNIVGTPLSPNAVITPPPPPPLPAIVTPTSAHFEGSESLPTAPGEHAASSATSPQSGTTTTTSTIISTPAPGAHPGSAQPVTSTSMTSSSHPHSVASPTSALPLNISHPPSPTHGPTKRLSFMSYSDLLTSTPTSTLPLSSLTTSASTTEPPPHIPAVVAVTGSPAAPGLLSPGSPSSGGGAIGRSRVTSSAGTSLRGFAMQSGKRDSMAMMDDVGGEWEREGLGRGLEERLEALITIPPAHLHHVPQQHVVVTRT